jgi:hypothetical protein
VEDRINGASKEIIRDVDVDIIHLHDEDQVKAAVPMCLSRGGIYMIYNGNMVTFVSRNAKTLALIYEAKTGTAPATKGSVLTATMAIH